MTETRIVYDSHWQLEILLCFYLFGVRKGKLNSMDKQNVVVEQVDAAQVKFSMPVVMFTYEHLRAMMEQKLGRIPCLLFLYVLGNMNASTGTVSDILPVLKHRGFLALTLETL